MEDNRRFLGELCLESLLKQYDEELACCEKKVKTSLRHRIRMRHILKYGTLPAELSPKKRVLVAALVAAVLFLTACATVIYGEQILNFWVETYRDHFSISRQDDSAELSSSMTARYALEYVPEGYTLAQESVNNNMVYYRWEHENGDYFTFVQSRVSNRGNVNNDGIDPKEVVINGKKMLQITADQRHNYSWSENGYDFKLSIAFSSDHEELLKIIQGIRMVQERVSEQKTRKNKFF